MENNRIKEYMKQGGIMKTRNEKEWVGYETYHGGKYQGFGIERRVIYNDSNGDFVRVQGKKYYLHPDVHNKHKGMKYYILGERYGQ